MSAHGSHQSHEQREDAKPRHGLVSCLTPPTVGTGLGARATVVNACPAARLENLPAVDHDGACVVVGRRSGALRRLVLESVAKRLILHADRLILVPPEPWWPSEVRAGHGC